MTGVASLEPVDIDDLKKGILVPQEAFDLWLKKYDWQWQRLARNEFPHPFPDLEAFQLACFCADPVLFSEHFLRNPKKPEEGWGYFDYQIPSARYEGHTVHECAAGVGKTYEIIRYIIRTAILTDGGSGLVTAPQFVQVLDIVNAILKQCSLNKWLRKALVEHRKVPHHFMRFDSGASGFEIEFRPTGHDGEQLRGTHIDTFIIMDEAVKAKNPMIFEELWGRGEPGCVYKLYSTPDGDRSCEFYKACRKAEGKQEAATEEEGSEIIMDLDFKKFHWSKEMMPAPFWTPDRKKFYVNKYGSTDAPQYQRVILGNWGDPENSVFPWHTFQRLLKDIPDYRVLKIMIDQSIDEVTVTGMKYVQGADGKYEEVILRSETLYASGFDIKEQIKTFFSNTPGLKFCGADLGLSQDPSEIYVKLIFGNTHRLIARVQLKFVTYDQQAEAIDALDDVFDAGEMKLGWGIDFGNAGSALVNIMQGQELYAKKLYTDRMTGYLFGEAYDSIDEKGEVLMNKITNKPVRLLGKELSTDLLVGKAQRMELEYPHDPDIMLYYPNHTYRTGPKHRVFRDQDDHTIDADRALTMRVLLPGEGANEPFACASNVR